MTDTPSRRGPPAPPPPWEIFPPPWEILPPVPKFSETPRGDLSVASFVAALRQFPKEWTVEQVLGHVTTGSPELPPPPASESSAPDDRKPDRAELGKKARFA